MGGAVPCPEVDTGGPASSLRLGRGTTGASPVGFKGDLDGRRRSSRDVWVPNDAIVGCASTLRTTSAYPLFQRRRFFASRYKMFPFTFDVSISFSCFHIGQAQEHAEWQASQLTGSSLQISAACSLLEHLAHVSAPLQLRNPWLNCWHLKHCRGFGTGGSLPLWSLVGWGIECQNNMSRLSFNTVSAQGDAMCTSNPLTGEILTELFLGCFEQVILGENSLNGAQLVVRCHANLVIRNGVRGERSVTSFFRVLSKRGRKNALQMAFQPQNA